MIFLLDEQLQFPPIEYAEPDGLLAVGGDLSVKRLLLAYSSGVFPWFNPADPILWYTPDPRPIFIPGHIKVSKTMRQLINRKKFSVSFDWEFEKVLDGCASVYRHGQNGTWLSPQMKYAYINLYDLGFAHSVEVWYENDLVGGLYGVTIGKYFAGESMFHIMDNASKIGFYYLSELLAKKEFQIIDGQSPNSHLQSLGSIEISRSEFLEKLNSALGFPTERLMWRDIDMAFFES